MAKIFQLEIFIKEMSIWKLPHESEDCDETCVDVTVFNNEDVPINGYIFGKNSTMNRGQNFLFTLDAMPTDENKVFFNVFKKAYNRDKKFLGSGKIPIDKIFDDIFSQTFYGTTKKISSSSNQRSIAAANNTTVVFASEEKGQGVGISDTAQSTVQTPNTVTDTNVQNSNGTSNATSSNTAIFSTADKFASKENVRGVGGTNSDPISKLTKDVYPIIGCDSKQWGTVCILMRLTSFGRFAAHPIHIHQSQNEIILQNTPNTAMYKCVPLDDLMNNKPNAFGHSVSKHPPIDYCTAIAKSRSRSEANSKRRRDSSCSSNDTRDIALTQSSSNFSNSDFGLCPAPPGSPNNNNAEYEEFKVEINDNALCVRMPKNAGIVKRIYENHSNSSKKLALLNNGASEYSEHLKQIPIIRGNRKYPSHYGAITSFPSSYSNNGLIYDKPSAAKDFSLQCNENRVLQDDDISCPSDVQIIRKSNDPKRDVFILKIGKDQNDGIQLEMKTPKNPLASKSAFNQTTSSQTYPEDFVGKTNRKGGKKGGNKGRKK